MQTSLQSFKSSQKVNILDGTTGKKIKNQKCVQCDCGPAKPEETTQVYLQQKEDGICTLEVDC